MGQGFSRMGPGGMWPPDPNAARLVERSHV